MKSALTPATRLLASTITLLSLAGCHAYKEKNAHLPTPLANHFRPTVRVIQLWHTRIGNGAGSSGVRMRPMIANNVLYAASTTGTLVAIHAKSGKKIWMTQASQLTWHHRKIQDVSYTGGPAVADNLLVIGTLHGHVYGMNAKTGHVRWQVALGAAVIAAPLITNDLVIVRTQDGDLYGLNRHTGVRRWVYDQSAVAALSLRGDGAMLALHHVVVFGSAHGKLTALRQKDGEKIWDIPLAKGTGRSEIARLDDADGNILFDGNTLYAAAYHGNLLAVNAASGRPLWSHPFSTYTGLAMNNQSLYGVDDLSQIWAFDKSDGESRWKNIKLRYRWLSAPAVQGNYVVVGDRYGYIHWLQTGDGALAARVRLARRAAIRARPLVVDGVVYIEDVSGYIGAYRLAPVAPTRQH